ncbi:unnamed protein product, partial [Mesorhabditis spiculigera]
MQGLGSREYEDRADTCRPPELDRILEMPLMEKKQRADHEWDPSDHSPNIYIDRDNLSVFSRIEFGTTVDCVRGAVAYRTGFHVWEINWPRQDRGPAAIIGFGNRLVSLCNPQYRPILGIEPNSFGWNISQNVTITQGGKRTPYPHGLARVGPNYTVGDTFYCILDLNEGTMAFATDTQYLGVAYRGLRGPLYLMASSEQTHCQVTLTYRGGLNGVRRLEELCRAQIRRNIGRGNFKTVVHLPLPRHLRRYILFEY